MLGHAMKAHPITVNGHELSTSGTIMSKALIALESDMGIIDIFVIAG